ncbi:MAG: hypothetical protein V3U11_08700, partial [Planctomycetota bacterium]
VHDCCVLRGRAYLANGRSYSARIMDASKPASLVEIGRCNTPGGYNHSCWVSDDDKILCITDEVPRGLSSPHMTVWDISNPKSPVKRGDYDLGTRVHNVFILGRTAYMSHYNDGVHIVDIADPTKPTMIAKYDTSTSTRAFEGCWGVHVFSDHGLIYASDRQNGLYVFQMDCGHMNRYGKGTPGTGGLVPRMRFDGAPLRVGASKLRLEVENLRPNAKFVIAVASAQGSSTVLGAQVHVDLKTTILLHFLADANGNASVPASVPNIASLGNTRVYMQVAAADPGAPAGLSASRGMWAGICK